MLGVLGQQLCDELLCLLELLLVDEREDIAEAVLIARWQIRATLDVDHRS
jgi:hypothetical protein